MYDDRRILKKRDLGARGRNYCHPATLERWIATGRFPPPDLRLPGNEKAWYQSTVDAWEATHRTRDEEAGR